MKKLLMGVALLLGTAASADGLLINGAGATFPYPIYSKWFNEYDKIDPASRSTTSPSAPAAASSRSPRAPSTSAPAMRPMTDDQSPRRRTSSTSRP